ncbi:MAG: prephenate dehydrogenase/arogenate dehydrogenase family protein [Verrucomicrobiales bacterium]|nr:prephenate dehydrogenase/arogenate dehydrogenase family protein [Verrucomicrobiales bacterium]
MSVLGPGLIGGSLLKAARAKIPGIRLQAWARREAVRDQLRSEGGVVDEVFAEVNDAIKGADLIVLAMPTGAMARVVEQFSAESLNPGALVTDVGSVKGSVIREVAPLVSALGARFWGSHPMAGSENAGLEFSESSLFEGASIILTPPGEENLTPDPALKLFWELLGGQVSVIGAARHDAIVASISHLPHLIAAALVRSVMTDDRDAAHFSGGGFRDTTRVAGGPEEMWSGILSDNHEAVSESLGKLIRDLEIWKAALDTLDREQLRGFLCEARQLRESL